MNRAQALDYATWPITYEADDVADLTYEDYLQAEADHRLDIERGK